MVGNSPIAVQDHWEKPDGRWRSMEDTWQMIYEELSEERATRCISINQCARCNSVRLGRKYVRIPGLRTIAFQQSLRLPLIQGLALTTVHELCEKCVEELRLAPLSSRY